MRFHGPSVGADVCTAKSMMVQPGPSRPYVQVLQFVFESNPMSQIPVQSRMTPVEAFMSGQRFDRIIHVLWDVSPRFPCPLHSMTVKPGFHASCWAWVDISSAANARRGSTQQDETRARFRDLSDPFLANRLWDTQARVHMPARIRTHARARHTSIFIA